MTVPTVPHQSARSAAGGLIDRSRPLRFRFDGRDFTGFAGDTLASALVANGVRLLGRSFKYHRPRGLLSAGPEEPNALVELRGGDRREPNTRATVAELFDGLEATSQNRWPSLGFDLLAVNRLLGPAFAAGFYYKTFMWPASFWERVYEPMIRRAAGLGRIATGPDPDSYEKAFAFCDLLVVGAGPAGLTAALAAARAGLRVLLAEEDFRPGGRLLGETRRVDGVGGADWVGRQVAELASLPNVRVMLRTSVFGSYDHGTFGAIERVNDHVPVPPPFEPRQRLWRIVARRCVLATGAIERPLLFADNDLPGVMLAGAARCYANRFAALAGRRVVVFADNDDAWRTAGDLGALGAEVVAVVDPRPLTHRPALPAGVEAITGTVRRALGGRSVRAVEVVGNGDVRRLDCDLVAMSGGWMPTLHLASHQGARPRWDEGRARFAPGSVPPGMGIAGAANGDFTTRAALASGAEAAVAAATALGRRAGQPPLPEVEPESDAHAPLWAVPASRRKCFVDFQNDVTVADVELAGREGFRSPELAKRYTTLGMATDQGKTANLNALALLAADRGQPIAATGTTTYRPPYVPVAIAALAGPHRGPDFRPTRLTAAHGWAVEQGAVFMEAGAWLRAQYFPQAGEPSWLESMTREVNATRRAVGVCDVSTLGKIDVQGPDACEFIERLYANGMRTLAVGRARYGIMLREDGMVLDDGTVSRLAEQRYLVTTTTANAVAVFQHMQLCHQVHWPTLDVQFVSVSDQWAQFSVAGPRSRDLLRTVVAPDHDLSNEALPFMAVAAVRLVDGTRARLFRISFSGEHAYEIAVPARAADGCIRALMRAGGPLGAAAYGLEALGAMRIEKGHVAGNELNGQTSAHDLGLGRLLSTKKDYIGAVMARRGALTDPARPRLVGFAPVDRSQRLGAGAHFVPVGAAGNAADDQGFMTSAAYSPTLGHWIGLGLLARGPERIGERVVALDLVRNRRVEVEVCNPAFVDPNGDRLRG
ncbi:MAG: sarcosine oxidase subunit alpha family protein [Proteobacteria bacterium]|nr:sarcosine oxidase subunit alpha family protein [Pseudomonadota bacterium]